MLETFFSCFSSEIKARFYSFVYNLLKIVDDWSDVVGLEAGAVALEFAHAQRWEDSVGHLAGFDK